MKRLFLFALPVVLAACGGASGSSYGAGSGPSTPAVESASPSASAAVTTATTVQLGMATGIGQVLTDKEGMTLYRFTADTPGHSACASGCTANWPPLTVTGTATAGAGISGALGTLVRADGSNQVTYKGAPLYTYAGDSKAGDAKGNGLLGKWFAVTP